LGSRLRVALCSALCFGVSSFTGTYADDTSIYVNAPVRVDSNILFILDSSGSMTENVSGSNQTRMDAVKQAMTQLINDEGNLNMGLERFHYYLGAPIVFPITPLNSNPDFLGQNIAVAPVSGSADDAEEYEGGTVLLTDALLDITVATPATPPSAEIKMEESIIGDHDQNVDQWESGGQGTGSEDIDIGERVSALRFRDIDVEKNATILSAEIVFTGNAEDLSGETHTVIHGLEVSDMPGFDDITGGVGDFLNDNRTSEGVIWSNVSEDLSAGEATSTPNLRTVIQNIVTQDDWEEGNAMGVMFTARQGRRTMNSYDEEDGDAPILKITYAAPGVIHKEFIVEDLDDDAEQYTDNGTMVVNGSRLGLAHDDGYPQALGVRFNGIDIPQGSEILWADVEFDVHTESGYRDEADFSIDADSRLDPPPFGTGNNDITGRPDVTGQVLWEDVFAPRVGEPLLTPNLGSLVDDLVADTDWAPGNAFVFIFGEGGSLGGRRALCSRDGVDNGSGCPEEAKPLLNVFYVPPAPAGTDPVDQTVGLRFNNLTVPQGATIEQAFLEFRTGAVSTTPGAFTIHVESSTNAAEYSTTSHDITGRTYFGSTVSWDTTVDPWDTVGEIKQSADVSDLVQQVVGQTDNPATTDTIEGWCGGNAIAFKITGDDARVIADSWDKSPATAPVLRVLFNTESITDATEGCIKQKTVSLITTGMDDVEEDVNGNVRFNDDTLDLRDGRHVGLRFQGIQIPRGAQVTSAKLTFSSYDNRAGSIDMDIDVQQHPNGPDFSNTEDDVSSRISGTARQFTDVPAIEWDEDDNWIEGEEYATNVNLAPLIGKIIDGTVKVDDEQWSPGNALVFSVRHKSGNTRIISSVNINTPDIPKRPAELEIEWLAQLGSVDLSPLSTRQWLIQTINDIQPRGRTPTVDSLFEALSYFESANVHYGLTRGAGRSYEESGPTSDTDLDDDYVHIVADVGINWEDSPEELLKDAEFGRLSHPETYVDAGEIPAGMDFQYVDPTTLDNTRTIFRDGSCQEVNPNNPDCRTEHIETTPTSIPQYKSPFLGAKDCEKGFVILLSDGIANSNSSRDLIMSQTGVGSCEFEIPTIDADGKSPDTCTAGTTSARTIPVSTRLTTMSGRSP
jgi:type IV pilus assembly protein PilY1